MVPYAVAIRNNFLFMDNNARPRVLLVNNMLQEAGIERIDWSSQIHVVQT